MSTEPKWPRKSGTASLSITRLHTEVGSIRRIGIFSRQCLGHRRIPDLGTLRREAKAWIDGSIVIASRSRGSSIVKLRAASSDIKGIYSNGHRPSRTRDDPCTKATYNSRCERSERGLKEKLARRFLCGVR